MVLPANYDMENLQYLIKKRLIPEYKRYDYITTTLDVSEYDDFKMWLHRNNQICKNTNYYFETQEDFGGYAIKNKNTDEIKQFKLAFPYSKDKICLNDDEDLYNLGNTSYTIKKQYIFGSVKHYDVLFVLCELFIIIACFLTFNLVIKIEDYNFIYTSFFSIFYLTLFYLPFKIPDIPKKKDKQRIEKQNSFINGLKTEL